MNTRVLLLVMTFLSLTLSVSAQGGRKFIKDKIAEWGSCRNVAITMTGGDLALNWNNAYASSGIPSGLAESLEELNDKEEFIDDVQLTEDGRWLILYGDNGFIWNNIPYSLELKLREFNDKGEIVTSVTFNDNGGWIIISKDYIAASSSEVYGWIEDGIESFGQLWAAHMTDDGLVLCYEGGYKFMGYVPNTLREKLKKTKIDVFRIKFLNDGTFFIADKYGNYDYWM